MIAKRTARLITAAILATLIAHTANAAANEGEMCGGIAGITCTAGLWCDPEPGRCYTADAAGVCIKVQPFCTRDYRPVCGSDGKTYGNDCTRKAAKVALNHKGECRNGRR